METKKWYQSKELVIGMLAVLNFGLSAAGLPAIDPSPELYTAILTIMTVLRGFVTDTKVQWGKDKEVVS